MSHSCQNPSNNCIANTRQAVIDIDSGITIIDISPPSITPPRATTAATLPTQGFGCNQSLPNQHCIRHPPLAVAQPLPTDQASDQVSTIITQLQATAVQLQSENQQIKTEIHKIIREIVDTPILSKEPPSSEWCSILSSGVETQILQSNYDELWNSHLDSSCEITADLYTKMIQRRATLRRRYEQTLESHMMLQDILRRLTQQPTHPFPDAPLLIYLKDNEMPIVGSQIVLDAFLTGGGFSQATSPAVHGIHFARHPNQRCLEQQAPSTGGVKRLNGYLGPSTLPVSRSSKRRKVGVA